MKYFPKCITVAVTIGILTTGTAWAQSVTLDQVAKAVTVAEFMALGAKPLSSANFKKKVIGHKMVEIKGSWDWIINKDGTAVSGGQRTGWKMKGNLYCRGYEKGQENCSQALMIGKYLRMTQSEKSEDLSGWTVKVE